jgi:hypothetical protein
MERAAVDPSWLQRLRERIDAGEFARDAVWDADTDATAAADGLDILCWAIARPRGRLGWEFWCEDDGRWYSDCLTRTDRATQHVVPGRFTRLRECPTAEACTAIDETGTARPVAVLARDRPEADAARDDDGRERRRAI